MKGITLFAMMTLITDVLAGQAGQDIKLNTPDMERGLKKLFSLTETQYPMLNNPVGYPNE